MNAARYQTLRIAKILAWEYWVRDLPGLLLAIIAALVLPEGCHFVSLVGNAARESASFLKVILSDVSIYWITILCLGSILLLNMGNPRVRNTLPASGLILVAIPMACCMLTMFVQYAIVAAIVNKQFGVEWPIVGPGLLAAVVIAWCHAVFWATSNSLPLRLMVLLLSFGPLAIWAKGKSPSSVERCTNSCLPSAAGKLRCSAWRRWPRWLWGPPASPACGTARRSTCRD